ncbi:alpha/beta hydrolase family protein [Aestuariivivens sediminis]|uniref:alpha/beta hydrolase family protein n=1 Tax=Aestuariivivens sediminis TaxID=2913557 RepID=UPI001F5984A4|nr:alpha/beta fold hydrolase [Aestuariivivens sediminis]
MNALINIVIEGKHNKPILVDAFFNETPSLKPMVIFCHGYKGFKDWGAWTLMAKAFAEAGFCFIKFNFSHNGGTVEQPLDFPDLEAFGNNNYTKELDDLETVMDWACTNETIQNTGDVERMYLMGHSRGGGIVLIKAEEDPRVKKVVSLSGVSDFGKRSATTGDLEQWQKDGVKYVLNGRTKQLMPHYYQFYEDFIANQERLNIKRAVLQLKKPLLMVHGNADTSVSIDEAYQLREWSPSSELFVVNDANHVFGAHHPWSEQKLPDQLLQATNCIIKFLR